MKLSLDTLGHRFEAAVVVILQVSLMVMVGWAIAELLYLLGHNFVARSREVSSVADVQEIIERAFAGALLVLIGLELLESVRAYFHEHRVRLEVILTVSTIAVVRHVIVLDLTHAAAGMLYGTAALVLALTLSVFLVHRARSGSATGDAAGGVSDTGHAAPPHS